MFRILYFVLSVLKMANSTPRISWLLARESWDLANGCADDVVCGALDPVETGSQADFVNISSIRYSFCR